jgi:3-(methylthio)propionyl---CoA ligase
VAYLTGLMQDVPLMISAFLRYADDYHSAREIVSRDHLGREHRLTYAMAAARARRLAKALSRAGVEPGDRVATLATNHHRHLELFYGVSGTGAVLHTVNPRLFEDQIAYICQHAEDRILCFDPPFAELVARLAPRLRSTRRYVVLGDPADADEIRAVLPSGMDVTDYETLISAEDDAYAWPVFDEQTASSLCYTSGTTGNPKGVLYSHRSTVLHALAACQNAAMGLSAHDTIMPIAPMYHANAWSTPYLAPLLGAKLVLPGPKLDGESVHGLIDREHVTFTVAVPTVFTTLLEYLERTGKRIDTLTKATIGGTAVPPTMIDLLREKYGCFVAQVWGMTELSPLGTMTTLTPAVAGLPVEEGRQFLNKQGRAQFGLELKLKDDAGHRVPLDGATPGALWVRGPWAAASYFKGEGGAVLDSEGFFPTGDVATLDAHGYLRITDRVKDLIKSGGEWISSVQLESLAYAHPSVRLAAVVAAHHPKWDERPILIVEPHAGASVSKTEILDHLRERVAKWWLPDDVVFIETMPMTATGKIRKTELRERFSAHLIEGAATVAARNPDK